MCEHRNKWTITKDTSIIDCDPGAYVSVRANGMSFSEQ